MFSMSVNKKETQKFKGQMNIDKYRVTVYIIIKNIISKFVIKNMKELRFFWKDFTLNLTISGIIMPIDNSNLTRLTNRAIRYIRGRTYRHNLIL